MLLNIERWLLALSLIGLLACGQGERAASQLIELTGRTMGTTWDVKLVASIDEPARRTLQNGIQTELDNINQLMSTYSKDSELSRFNQSDSTDWYAVSPDTAIVVDMAQRISRLSGGAFDITVGPLVNLWGFGPEARRDDLPDQGSIDARRAHIGYQKLAVRLEPPALKKSDPQLYVDLSGIAKGYAVDRVAEFLEAEGYLDYMVEVGGELRLSGKKPGGQDWRIAVEQPVAGARAVHRVVTPGTAAMATSGDYRNFIEVEGRRYSHTIDPNTGWPVDHHLTSVSVIHESCMEADALATALTVLGPEQGMMLVEQQGLAVYMIETLPGQEFRTSMSRAFSPMLDHIQ